MKCRIEGCSRTVTIKKRQLCGMHYQRWRKHGDPLSRGRQLLGEACSVEGCDDPPHARGLCPSHYCREWRYGDPLAGGRRLIADAEARFWSYVDKGEPDECWLWTGTISTNGYGRFADGRDVMAHRWSYEHHIGPIPEGLDLDHLCHGADPTCTEVASCLHRRCVNPAHLEPVTRLENLLRGNTIIAGWAARRSESSCA